MNAPERPLPAMPARCTAAVRLRWPLPALLGWAAAWAVFLALQGLGMRPPLAWGAAALVGVSCALQVAGGWRRLLVALGFPLSGLALGASVPAWGWILAVLPLGLLYPLRAWADAPLFPTPRAALDALAQALPLPADAAVLDAGCGLGDGLQALRRAWPQARLHGVEWSLPASAISRWRCGFARVCRGDMWARSWSAFDAVYLFQRPESMARAWAKATSDLPAGAWLLSLEFPVPGVAPTLQLPAGARRVLWCYRMPGPASTLAAKCR